MNKLKLMRRRLIMKVKVKCEKCHKTFKGKATDLKNAKALKKLYKENQNQSQKSLILKNKRNLFLMNLKQKNLKKIKKKIKRKV